MNSVLRDDSDQEVDPPAVASRGAPVSSRSKESSKFAIRRQMFPVTIIALLVALLVNATSDFWLLKVPCVYEKKARLMEKARCTQVVTLGSSHGLFGIRPDCMSTSTINLANASQTLVLDDQILSKVFSESNRLKLAIIPVSYFSLYNDLVSNREQLRDPFYSRFMGVSQRSAWERTIDIRYWSLAAAYGPNYLIGPLQGQRSFWDLPTLDDFGWGSRCQELAIGKISKKAGRRRVRWHEKTMHEKHRPQNERAIKHMIDECNKRNVDVLIVMMPVFTTYSDCVNQSLFACDVKFLSSLQTNNENQSTPPPPA